MTEETEKLDHSAAFDMIYERGKFCEDCEYNYSYSQNHGDGAREDLRECKLEPSTDEQYLECPGVEQMKEDHENEY